MGKKIFGSAATLLLLMYFLTLVLHISANYDKYLWDFRTHRKAGQIFASGQNPYDPDVLLKHKEADFLYTYPPITLSFYWLFTLTAYKTAAHIFLIAKCVLLIGLVLFWKREFLAAQGDTLFYFFSLLAFNSAIFADMIAGNINLLEQVLLWLAFFFYLKHRFILFSTFVLIAASIKMTPIVFLGLLLISENKNKYLYLVGALLIFLAYLLIQYLIVPDMFAAFIQNALTVVGEKGAVGPSTTKFVNDLFRLISKILGPTSPALVSTVVIVLAAVVVSLSARAYVLLKRIETEDSEKIALFLVCLVYALIHPRFKDYAYMLLIVPSYYIMKNTRYTKAFPFIFVLCVLASPHLLLPGIDILSAALWPYFPLMLAYMIWGLYLFEIFSWAHNKKPEARPRA